MTEGPFEGSRCLASVEGTWAPATIRKAYADGTFRIELDEKSMIVLPQWYGVTRTELRFEDAAMWPACRQAFELPERFGLPELRRFIAFHWPEVTDAGVAAFWGKTVEKLFGVGAEAAAAHTLDPDEAYRVIVRAGYSAAETVERHRGAPPPEQNGRIYWNQVRMGGRAADDVARPITVDDALDALGLTPAPAPADAGFPVALPAALRSYYRGLGNDRGVASLHPNNPSFVRQAEATYHGLRAQGLDGDLGAAVLEHHDFEWVAVFDPDDADARIYVNWDGEDGRTWRQAAPSVGFFFWDVAQTGLAWWDDTKHTGGKRVRRTDVGLALVR